ncbi:hypothetical protein [Roseateles violae]|uniref:Transporter n=1 Tax=Roseateles violae TaxID=3058042 RepID=A0ABT8DQH1_9BURK|nr:hypothetical protein [Pelomonas sp. PFR6]MDN3919189.1 hypothetical protein [Pelomonas sp. PFR6]
MKRSPKSVQARLSALPAGLLAGLLGGLLPAAPAQADPGYYLLTPYSTPGVAALDLRYWTVKMPKQPAVLWPEAGLRYGVDSRWTTELFLSYIGESWGEQALSSWNWQNSYLLTQGQLPFDLALHAQLIRNVNVGNALEVGPVFQTDWGFTQINANLVFEHDWASNKGTQLKYQWQLMRRLQPGLRVGLQGFGELGPWKDWSDRQSHRAGPMMRLGLGETVELQAAYLWGKVYGRKAEMFSAQLLIPF